MFVFAGFMYQRQSKKGTAKKSVWSEPSAAMDSDALINAAEKKKCKNCLRLTDIDDYKCPHCSWYSFFWD